MTVVQERPAARRSVSIGLSFGLILKLVAFVLFLIALFAAVGWVVRPDWYVSVAGGLAAWVLSEIVP